MNPLLERESELAAIAARLAAAREGAGGLVVLEGPAGIGKTRLLAEAQASAQEAGMTLLSARGGELERHFPFGIVRQLFEPSLTGATASERKELLDGAARLAAPLFGLNGADGGPNGDGEFATLHGLYWLSVNLAARSPLMIAIDDVHWADAASLRWLVYLARRVEGLPLLSVLALRTGEHDSESELLAALAADPLATVLRPERLSERAVAKLVRAALAPDADPEFCSACRTATVGNPLLLHHLLGMLAEDGIEPTRAAAERVRDLAPTTVARAVVLRLARLPAAAGAIARAVAVLEADADLRHAAALADVDEGVAQAAVDALVAAEILAPERPLRFAHPITRQAIYADLPAGQRAQRHALAARLLADDGAPPEAVAVHLLLADPGADVWVVETLRSGAQRALDRGAPEVAVSYLRRALLEPPAAGARAGLLWELGSAEARAHEPGAIERLGHALESSSGPAERGGIAAELCRLLTTGGRGAEAIEVLEPAIADLAGDDRELAARLEADLNLAAWFASPPQPRVAARLVGLRERVAGQRPGDSALLAGFAFEAFMTGGPAGEAAQLAERALAEGKLLAEEGPESPAFGLAVAVLTLTDQLPTVERISDNALADARDRGSIIGFAAASCWRARNSLFAGAVADAEADARLSLGVAQEHGWELGLPASLAFLIDALTERGETDAAAAALQDSGIGEQLPESLMFQLLLHSRGRLRILQGQDREGLEDLLACGRREQSWGIKAPGMAQWRASAAPVLAAAGDQDKAARLASEELALAHRFGAPRPLGIALRAAGLVAGGTAGIELLREAVAVLEDSPALLERARAVIELGSALRHASRRTDAREPLRRGLEIAHRCGATALASRAREELLGAGARPRRPLLTGVHALTPSERRVAGLAAEGLSNPAIAQALFVTLRTVEMHLTHTYRKLEISSRTALAAALITSGSAVGGP